MKCLTSYRPGVCKLWPMGQVWPVVKKISLALDIARILLATWPFINFYFLIRSIRSVL